MPSSTTVPDSDVGCAYTSWTWDTYTNVYTNDGDSTYMYANRNDTVASSFPVGNISAAAASIISPYCYASALCRRSGTGTNSTYKAGFYQGGNTIWNSSGTTTSDSYVTNQYNSSTEPGGGSWTVAIVNDLQIGVYNIGPGSNTIRCTYLWLVAYWQYGGGGGAAWLLNSIVPLMIGWNLQFSDLAGIRQEMLNTWKDNRRDELYCNQQEKEQLWIDLQGWRYPKIFDIGGAHERAELKLS